MTSEDTAPIHAGTPHPMPRSQRGDHMNTSPAQTTVDTVDLAGIAELLAVIDEFLRSGNGVADRLVDYLAAVRDGRAHPPGGLRCDADYLRGQARYDANLLIDEVSFAAHALRAHRAQHRHDEGGQR